jgi:hypothetical protein
MTHTVRISLYLKKHSGTRKYSFTTLNYNVKAPFHLVL